MNGARLMTVKNVLRKALEQAVMNAQNRGIIISTTLPDFVIEHPQNREHGDYASNLPLKLARSAGLTPVELAEKVIELMPPISEVSTITVAPPGFINFSLNPAWMVKEVDHILVDRATYGKIEIGNNQKVQIEFVSGNPTGPLHVGHGRGAVLGSTLANVLQIAGYNVEREYYINDAGSQLDAFNRTLLARYKQYHGIDVEIPDDGYMGNYMNELAQEIAGEKGDKFLSLPENEAVKEIGNIGVRKVMDWIRKDLESLGVIFDVWFSEQSLFTLGLYEKVLSLLRKNGYVVEKENATWFISSMLGENKDNVLVRSDGTPTYFATDIAYHYDKFIERKFNKVINIWGADHHGHVSRMKLVVGAFGINPDNLNVIICQLVTLKRGDEVLKISKRSGDIITLQELIDEVGKDACRFVFLLRSADSQMDFDLELAKKQSADNPVYYVQYAHARISSILRLAAQTGIDYKRGDVTILKSEPELELIKQMLFLPEIVETVATLFEPHHLPYYAMELATKFHSFYKQCRVISEDQPVTLARLKLVDAAQIVLAKVLTLMGMTAPESM